ncbi:MAG: sensor histidine kinase, partial [Micromonosporaceae bacterium]
MRLSRSLIGDIVLSLVLTVIGLVGTTAANAFMSPDRPIDAAGYGLVIATGLVLSVRRRWPVVTLAVATLCASAYLVLGYTYGPILFSFFVAVYTVARHVPLARAWPPSAVALALLLTHIFTNSAALPGLQGLVPGSAWVVVPFAIGVTVRMSQEAVAQARAETVRQHVDEERLRVAQEVHDVVGHGLAAIKMQADVALHVLPKRPEQAEVALNAISRTSTAALDELRATLAVVRRTGTDAERTPAPGLERLDELRQRMSDAGVDVHLETSGERRAVPAAVELAGYRVVQESLTNVLRHGAEKVATVRIGYQTDAVTLAISNPVGAVRSRGGGLGIPGMRERVEALGGEFTA